MTTSFEDTVGQAKAGDREALEDLLARHRSRLQHAAEAMLGDKLRAKVRISDILQSTYLEVVSSIQAFRGDTEDSFRHWVTRILENNIKDAAKYYGAAKRARERETSSHEHALLGSLARGPSPSTEVCLSEELILVSRALQKLPDDYRRILLFRLTRGGTHEDAARIMGRSAGATRVLLARARASLLVELDKLRGDQDGE